jgi:nucleotide-binding universal stress UspA family protein
MDMEDTLFRRVLVAYDGSDQSNHALEHAAKEAVFCNGELIILTVSPEVHVPKFRTPGAGVITPMIEEYKQELKEEYVHVLKAAENSVNEKFPSLRLSTILAEGRPHKVICEEADKINATSIVIGNRGIHGVSGWILGDTSRKVVDNCNRPVLVVK